MRMPAPIPATPPLTPSQRRELRAAAHHLDPVVMIGDAGLSPGVLAEADRALTAHELIKVRVFGDDRQQRRQILETLCEQLGCQPVQEIGKLLVVYRKRPDKPPREHVPKKLAATGAAAPSRPKDRKPGAKAPANRPGGAKTGGAKPVRATVPRRSAAGPVAAGTRRTGAGPARRRSPGRGSR
jgi:RNA-binding protein